MILVVGANGFVGRHLVNRLAQRPGGGSQVRAMVRDRRHYTAPDGVDVVQADITRAETLPPALSGVECVVHCAAITGNFKEPYPGAYDDVHRGGTENLVRAAAATGAGRVVLMSGMKTSPAPAGTYMATRWAMEEAVRNSGIPYVIIQPSVQFGAGAEFVAALGRLVKSSPVVPLLGGGGLRFQPIWVEDVVSCVEKSIDDDVLSGHEYPIGGSEYVTFKEVIEILCKALGKRRLKVPLPLLIARLQAPVMALPPRPPLTRASLELFGFDNVTQIDAVDRAFGFHPQGFRDYIAEHGVEF